MNGIWILLLLLSSAALPVIVVFFWFRAGKFRITSPWFLASLAAGIISLLPAALIQNLFPHRSTDGFWPLLFGVFIRIALVEEASRIATLLPMLKTMERRQSLNSSLYAAFGLVAGLGFAAAENAFYGTADINITLLRVFTAAPLHGACGIRAGITVYHLKQRPQRSFFLFLFSVLIHGAYNLLIISPALPSFSALLVAYAAFFSSIAFFKNTEENIPKLY